MEKKLNNTKNCPVCGHDYRLIINGNHKSYPDSYNLLFFEEQREPDILQCLNNVCGHVYDDPTFDDTWFMNPSE